MLQIIIDLTKDFQNVEAFDATNETIEASNDCYK